MTIVKILRHQGKVVALDLKGHAGYSEAGTDIVCAGLSALAQATVGALLKLLPEENVQYEQGDEDGTLSVALCDIEPTELTEAIFSVAVTGFEMIGQSYPEYVRVINKVCDVDGKEGKSC